MGLTIQQQQVPQLLSVYTSVFSMLISEIGLVKVNLKSHHYYFQVDLEESKREDRELSKRVGQLEVPKAYVHNSYFAFPSQRDA